MFELNLEKNSIITYTNIVMNPTQPEARDISIIDIAHALSFMCRANGHIRCFFSVAQHCINCSYEAKVRGYSKKVQLALLLHDASEAYISDIIRPVKHNLEKYLEIERNLQGVIYKAFGIEDISEREYELIGEIDNAMLQLEFIKLADRKIFNNDIEFAQEYNFEFREFFIVENEYIAVFNELSGI